jgi:preprotein translocase subunit SecA
MTNQNLFQNSIGRLFQQNNYQKKIDQIKSQSAIFSTKTEEELKEIIEKIKRRLNEENLNDILPDWFAVTQEISFRTIGLKHFDTQLLSGMLLHQGKVVEMKTGEGKTLASTLAVSLNSLSQKGVHVVTVNEYLAQRDQQSMGKIYKGLGLTTGLILDTYSTIKKQNGYNSDITYLTNSQVVFDYLRDSSSYEKQNLVQRPFNYCVIDEIDSILIDEARTPLIISENVGASNFQKLSQANELSCLLKKDIDFKVDEKRREVELTAGGYQLATQLLGKTTLFDPSDSYMLEILNALKANFVFKLNKDYMLIENKVVIVDEFTGRVMPDRRWSQGIHEAVEVKENVPVGDITKTKTGITYQNFFTLYPKLGGMSGTAVTTASEFDEIYKLKVVEVPTAKEMIRKDLPDLVYQTGAAKWKAVLEQTKECFQKGQPILIGTPNVEKSDIIAALLKASRIPHQILNAKPENVARESEIVALAGERFGVTIATNMAGRGTDIILGGNPIFKVKNRLLKFIESLKLNLVLETPPEVTDMLQTLLKDYQENKSLEQLEEDCKNLPYSLETSFPSLTNLYNYFYKIESTVWKEENRRVQELGGLFVLGTERSETRRIDNQLRGRSGRQGDPGTSQFYVSLEDDLIKIFGGDNIKKVVDLLLDDKDSPIQGNLLTNSLAKAQEKVELYYFETRKNVFEYDEVINDQRKRIFKARKEILCQKNYETDFLYVSESFLDQYFSKSTHKEKRIAGDIDTWFGNYSDRGNKTSQEENKNDGKKYNEAWISADLRYAHANQYDKRLLRKIKGKAVLEIIDFYWTEHIERMSFIRETIGWRSYGQQNPLIEYNVEAVNSYKAMYEQIQFCMIYYFLTESLLK